VVAVAGVTVLAAGELVSARIHNRNHEAVMADLQAIRAAQLLGRGDLVLTRTGADHVCNWLFRVRAGTVTSLEVGDFERYDRVLVLNPRDGQESWEALDGTVEDGGERYEVMRRNIPRPSTIEPLFATENLELFELREPPAQWLFGADGRWLGVRRRAEP
jgi:hypothetical protein